MEASEERRWFPMQGDGAKRAHPVPWEFAEAIYRMYSEIFGTEQSLERMAERGGFGYTEIEELAKLLKIRDDKPQG